MGEGGVEAERDHDRRAVGYADRRRERSERLSQPLLCPFYPTHRQRPLGSARWAKWCNEGESRFWWWLQRILVKEFVVAGVGRVFQGVEYPSRREACQARHREYVRALADGLNVTQSAHAVGVSKRTGKVWRNGRTRSSGRCERASIAPQAHWYRLYMKCQPHRVSKRFLSLKERMLIFGWRVEGLSIRDIARQLGRSPSTVSRELRRNGITSTCYNPYIAHMRAGKRLKRPKARKCAVPRLWGIIWDKLELRWSPEQICAYLRMRFPHKSEHEPVRRGRSTSSSSSKPQAHCAKRSLP